MLYIFKGSDPNWIYMKFFDLTFSGAVLPDRNPAEVKLGLARLFGIEDDAEIAEIFSGKTIVLRHHLDRRSAAEYFRKLAELGAKAALVESIDPLDIESSGKDSARAGGRRPPVFTSERLEKGLEFELEALKSEDSQPKEQGNLHGTLAENYEELGRLRVLMSQMKERSRQRYLALESRKEAFQRLAERELQSAAEKSHDALLRTQEELAQIEERAAQVKAELEYELDKLQREEERRRALSRDMLDSLETLMREAKEKARVRSLAVQTQREATRRAAELEIARLQQLLLDTQQQADIDDARLMQELDISASETRLELDTLEARKIEVLATGEQVIDSLLKQQNEARRRLEAGTETHKQKQQELQRLRAEEASRLIVQQQDIKIRREKGIEEVEKAGKQLEAMTRKNLKKLYALELQAKRRQNETREAQLNQVTRNDLADNATMH
jgi:hypothetical protein